MNSLNLLPVAILWHRRDQRVRATLYTSIGLCPLCSWVCVRMTIYVRGKSFRRWNVQIDDTLSDSICATHTHRWGCGGQPERRVSSHGPERRGAQVHPAGPNSASAMVALVRFLTPICFMFCVRVVRFVFHYVQFVLSFHRIRIIGYLGYVLIAYNAECCVFVSRLFWLVYENMATQRRHICWINGGR